MRVLASHYYRVFATPGFLGNPVTLHTVDALDDELALQDNASRSATIDNVYYCQGGGDSCEVRFFAPDQEIQFCGHGLLALARHLGSARRHFTRDVVAPGRRQWQLFSRDDAIWIRMPQAVEAAIGARSRDMVRLLDALDVRFENLYAFAGSVWVVVTTGLDSLLALRADLLQQCHQHFPRFGALVLTTRLSEGCYALRYFAPWHGKLEDSATGSAQAYLARLWLDRGQRCQVLQYGPQGVAQMTVEREADSVALTGVVEG